MVNNSKEKILGQFFSGEKIPELLTSLIQLKDVKNAIDPMCGLGDMFRPLLKHGVSLCGIEIDESIATTTQLTFPEAKIIVGNAFKSDTILSIAKENGYDLVITNPPYVRRELINPLASNGFHEDLSAIKKSLLEVLLRLSYISAEDKKEIEICINSISNLADLSIPSWILCLMLLRPGGQLALVVPTAWMNREYAQPIISLLSRLCCVNYIIVDANRVWFKDKAQVQTSLVVARRNYPGVTYINHTVKYVHLYSTADSKESLIGNLPKGINFLEYVESGKSLINYFDVDRVLPELIVRNEESKLSQRSKLVPFIDSMIDNPISFADLKVNIGQGLRTGANQFFYLKYNRDKCYSMLSEDPIEFDSDYFFPVIKSQDGLTRNYAVTDTPDDKVLYIQDAVLEKDLNGNDLFSSYSELPLSIQKYILAASGKKINGKPIPYLSAVKTNETKGSFKRLPRFWYMLPFATDRQYARVFVPRVNSGISMARINLTGEKLFLDANFTNFWLQHSSPLSEYALLAILNSSWIKIQFEELGSVMGGGALKLDAVQIKKCVLPARILEKVKDFDYLGHQLSESSIDRSAPIIEKIDSVIMDSLLISDPEAVNSLNQILNSYLSCRN